MLVVWSVLTAVLLLAVVRAAALSRRQTWRRRRVETLARRADLAADPAGEGGRVPAALLDRVGARIARRDLAAQAGAAAGALCVLLLLLTGTDLDRRGLVVDEGPASLEVTGSLLVLVGPMAVLVGSALAVLVVAAREALAPPADGVRRLARMTPVSLEDYVPRFETRVVRASCVVPLAVVGVVGATSLVLGRAVPDQLPAAAVLGVLAVVAWGAGELLCRRVLSQRQPAGSALELAWDDVLRARLLRDLVPLPLALGGLASAVLPFVLLPSALADPRSAGAVLAVALVLVLVLLVLLLALVVSELARPPEQYARRRLWPGPAAAATGGAP